MTVGPLAAAMAEPFGGEAVSVASAAEAAEALRPRLVAPATSCWSRPRAGVGPRGRRGGARRLMGEVLIGGTASLLMCVFLSPKFIEFLRVREFGQHIREEGPQEHHAKAGTPTMGGLIIFTAITIPFLFLLLADKSPGPDRARAARRHRRRAGLRRARASPTTTRRSSASGRSACAGARSSA